MKNTTINISLPSSLLTAADRQAELDLRNRSELIREALRQYLIKKGTVAGDTLSKHEKKRVNSIMDFAKFRQQHVLLLSCVFRPQPVNIPDLFAGPNSAVSKLLEKPPHFRHAGWDLNTLDQAKPIAGEFLQVTNGEIKIIRIYRDGQVVFGGDEEFIGHGVNKEGSENFAINGLAISELITNFVNFSYQLSQLVKKAQLSKMIFKIQLLNPDKEKVDLINVRGNFPFPDKVGEIQLDHADQEIAIPISKNFNFEKEAYKLLAEFFYFFGLTEDKFWYVDRDKKEIDLKFFKDN